MILVDTSVWVDFFRGTDNDQTRALRMAMGTSAVCICGPVLTEVLQGARTNKELRKAEDIVGGLVYLPTSRRVFRSAASLYRRACQAGSQPKSTIDCLIAACAIRHRVPLLHRDQHFDAIAKVSKLQVVPCP